MTAQPQPEALQTYDVTLLFDASQSTTVQAASIEEAIQLASDNIGSPRLCHQCTNEVELGDCYGEIVYRDDEMVEDTDLRVKEIVQLKERIAELEAELIHEAQRTAAEKLRADQMTEQHRQQAAMNAEARGELAKIEAEKANLRDALSDIASGEIMRSHCTGPHCVEELGVATADEMTSRAAGALDWDDRVAKPPTQLREKRQLEAALTGAEPVSGQCRFAGEKSWGWCAVEHVRMVQADPRYAAEGYEVRYLYAHPPASRQPLTDEQRRRILDKLGAHAEGLDGETWDQMVITAIEAAHNITGEPA